MSMKRWFQFKVVFSASFFFPFVNFISTIWTTNNTTICFWHYEKYVLITTMIWKSLRLMFILRFLKCYGRKHGMTYVFNNIMVHSYDIKVYWRGLKDIYLNSRKQKMLMVYTSFYIILWFFLFLNKCKNMERMNEQWNYKFHEYY